MAENDSSEDSRDRGILTPENRAFLRGETEYEYEQSAINARRRIRERVRNSILDFAIVFEYLSEDDLRAVVEEVKEQNPTHREQLQPEREFGDGMVDTVAFAGLCASELGSDFETLASAAIRRHAEKVDLRVDTVDVDVEVTYRDLFTDTERLERAFEEKERKLSLGELGLLVDKDVINRRQALEYQVEMYSDDEPDSDE